MPLHDLQIKQIKRMWIMLWHPPLLEFLIALTTDRPVGGLIQP